MAGSKQQYWVECGKPTGSSNEGSRQFGRGLDVMVLKNRRKLWLIEEKVERITLVEETVVAKGSCSSDYTKK